MVAGDLAAVKVQCAVLVNDDRAAILCNAAGDLDVGNVDGCVRYIQAAAVFIVYAGTLEDTGADAVRKGEMSFVCHAELFGVFAVHAQRLSVQAQVERWGFAGTVAELAQNQRQIDVGFRRGQII